MRLETTYKYLWRHGWDFCYEQNSFNRRKIRRGGRHQANLDLKRSVCEALDDVDFANMHFEANFDHHGFDDYDDFEDYLNEPEPDYEAQAAKWERDNDDYMFRNRIGPYEGWNEFNDDWD